MNAIRIGVADSQDLFRTGIALVLKNDPQFEVVATFRDGKTLVPQLQQTRTDVLLLDLNLRGNSGFSVIKQLARACPEIRVLVLSADPQLAFVAEMLRLGAAGFLAKQCALEELKEAILQVMRSEYYLNSLSTKAQKRRYARQSARNRLTPRERQVLSLICREYSTVEIAEHLQLGRSTIESYRKSLLAKTGARNLAGLVMYAIREEIVRLKHFT